MEENENFDSDFDADDIPISDGFWNYLESYWHNNRDFPESTESQLNKKADLVDGKIPSSQLPGYVDDVVEFDSFGNLPNPGEKGKIYLNADNNSIFRWNGTEYIQLNLEIDGELVIYNVPNSSGTILTYNPTTKKVSTRTNAEIISDLGLATDTELLDYWKKYFYGGYTGINTNDDFAILNNDQAQRVLTNGLLVSNNYTDRQYVPNQGIFSTGTIVTLLTGSSDLWYNAYNNGLVNRGRVFQSNVDANNLGNQQSAIISIELGNGTGNTNFPVNNAYGTFMKMSAQSFTSEFFHQNGGELWHRNWYFGGNPNDYQFRKIWDNVNFNPDTKDGSWLQSQRNFPNGTLIRTNIDYSQTSGAAFLLEMKGNMYGGDLPMDCKVQGYIYNDTIINAIGYCTHSLLTEIIATNLNGELCFWFPSLSYWQGFTVKVTDVTNQSNTTVNRAYEIANSADQGGTKRVNIPIQTIATRDWANQNFISPSQLNNKVDKSGDSMTGALTIKSNGVVGVFKGYDNNTNYLIWRNYPDTKDIGYIGADGNSVVGGGVGDGFGIIAPSGNLQLVSAQNLILSGTNIKTNSRIIANYQGSTSGQNLGSGGIGNNLELRNYDAYGMNFWSNDNGDGHIQVQRFDGNPVAYNLRLQPLGGLLYYGDSEVAKVNWVSGNYIPQSHPSYGITTTDINSWSEKFKTLRFTSDLESVTESGIYRQEGPTSGYNYTTTLNLNSLDGRQQLSIERNGGGMKFRGSNTGSGNTGWSSWKDVIHSDNITSYINNYGFATESWVHQNFVRLDIPQTIIGRKAFNGGTDNSYSGAALEVMGNGSTVIPGISFHQPGVVASQIRMYSDGTICIINGAGENFEKFRASVITAESFYSLASGNSSQWWEAYTWGNHANAGYLTSASLSGYATQSWVQSQNYANNNAVDERIHRITGEFFDPTSPVLIENKLTTIIRTEEHAGIPIDLDGELIPTGNITIINLSEKPLEILRSGEYLDTVLERGTTEYYITNERRIIRKGSYKSAQLLG